MTPEQFKSLLRLTANVLSKSWSKRKGYYTLSTNEAAQMACSIQGADRQWAQLVALSLDGFYNDVMDWANTTGHGLPIIDPGIRVVHANQMKETLHD